MALQNSSGFSVHDLERPEFWLQLNPGLHISDNPFRQTDPYPLAPGKVNEHLRQVVKEGYFQTDPVVPREECARLAAAIRSIFMLGMPGPFAFVYDEFWQLVGRYSQLLTPILGEGYQFMPDFWAWHVPKTGDASGWGPHRDYQHGKPALRADGRPTLLTMWIPLTDVTPLNACMYVLPQHLDPNYPDNIDVQTIAHDQLQSIRALPAQAGSLLCWNAYVIHWGGRSSEWAQQPRVSVGLYYQSRDVDAFDPLLMDIPSAVPFDFRLGVIGRAILMYNEHYLSKSLNFSKPMLGLCDKYASKLGIG